MTSNTSSPHAPQSALAAELRAAATGLCALVAGLEPKDVPLSWAPEVLEAFVEVERLAVSGRVLMTARAAEGEAWKRARFASAGDWLADLQGTTAGRARADLATSQRLGDLDATADAVRAGLLSPEQAGAVADAAAVNPEAERDLLDTAQRDSLQRTRQEAERRKAEARTEAERAALDERVRRERDLRISYSGGAGHLRASGPVADVKALEQQLQRLVDERFRAAVPLDRRERRGAYAFDALVGLGPAGGESSAGDRVSRRRPPPTRMTLIRVDLAALQRGHAEAGELCEIGGISVSLAELRRVLGDSVLQLVLTNGEAVVDLVNLQRRPTVAQKFARLFSDPGCRVEGCNRTARIEFDHRDPWALVLETRTDNLDPLCDHHHDMKSLHGWRLVEGTGRRPMVAPDDPRHPEYRGADPGAAAGGGTVSEGADGAPTISAGAERGPSDQPPTESTDRLADLAERLARIREKEARHRARLAGQGDLFDTG